MTTELISFIASAPFHAARRVDVLPAGHACRRTHGHNFAARATAQLPSGWGGDGVGGESAALRAAVGSAVAHLDYQNLNDCLGVPTDENLARHLHHRLQDIPGLQRIGIQSTAHQGVDLDEHQHLHVWRRFRFEAAHQLPQVPAGHPCGHMHGHGFEVVLHCNQTLASHEDLGIDYDLIAATWASVADELDHRCLNDLPGLENPTSEMLAAWLWRRLKPLLPTLSWVTVYETVTAGCHYDGEHFRIWKELRFEAALRLSAASESERVRRLHGHSYVLRLHLLAPLDQMLGWTVDYGDVKRLFEPVYRVLDHRRLDALPGLEHAGLSGLLPWIRQQAVPSLPQLDRLDLFETPDCGASLSWGPEAPALPS